MMCYNIWSLSEYDKIDKNRIWLQRSEVTKTYLRATQWFWGNKGPWSFISREQGIRFKLIWGNKGFLYTNWIFDEKFWGKTECVHREKVKKAKFIRDQGDKHPPPLPSPSPWGSLVYSMHVPRGSKRGSYMYLLFYKNKAKRGSFANCSLWQIVCHDREKVKNLGRKKCLVHWKAYCKCYKMTPQFPRMNYNPLDWSQLFYAAYTRCGTLYKIILNMRLIYFT